MCLIHDSNKGYIERLNICDRGVAIIAFDNFSNLRGIPYGPRPFEWSNFVIIDSISYEVVGFMKKLFDGVADGEERKS